MLINARPRHTLCCLHKHKCLPARGGGLIKDIHISSTGTYEHFAVLYIDYDYIYLTTLIQQLHSSENHVFFSDYLGSLNKISTSKK